MKTHYFIIEYSLSSFKFISPDEWFPLTPMNMAARKATTKVADFNETVQFPSIEEVKKQLELERVVDLTNGSIIEYRVIEITQKIIEIE